MVGGASVVVGLAGELAEMLAAGWAVGRLGGWAGGEVPRSGPHDWAHRLGESIDFGRADPYAPRLESRIGAAMDDDAAAAADGASRLYQVAMVPDAIILREVGASVLGLGLVVTKEAHGRCHKGRVAHELGLLADDRLATLAVESACIESQPKGLELALADRKRWVAQREARADVGAAGDGGEDQVLLDLWVLG